MTGSCSFNFSFCFLVELSVASQEERSTIIVHVCISAILSPKRSRKLSYRLASSQKLHATGKTPPHHVSRYMPHFNFIFSCNAKSHDRLDHCLRPFGEEWGCSQSPLPAGALASRSVVRFGSWDLP